VLVIVSGLPVTGKSTIAEAIGQARRAPVLSVDPIESAILRAGIDQSFETGLAAYLVARTLADAFLAVGLDVVIDAVSSVDAARTWWRDLAAKHGVPLRLIVCQIADEAEHRRRVSGRSRGYELSEPSWDSVEARRAEWTPWPEPHLTIDSLEPPGLNADLAIRYLEATP
jgi:predicted kinase